VIEQERQRLGRRLDEVARLCEANVPPGTFYEELLKRLLESLAAPAGAVWTRTAQGNLKLQFQINVKEVGLDRSDEARQSHEELLRQAVTQPRAMHLLPRSGLGPVEEGRVGAGNPTDFMLLLVPILLNGQVAGLIEVWQGANRPLNAVPGFLQFMTLMADLGARYQRNQMIGQLAGQQQLWTQLEAFTRQIHGSLNPTEVSYLIANEARRLVECDRVSVAVRRARRTAIEAVSGADVVEKRSNLVRLMRALCDRVLDWGEKLVFTGTKDDSLPPKVLAALDAYLAESPSKLLVVQPLRDERDGEAKSKEKKPPRSALLMECFEPPPEPQQLVARLDVVSRHATSALYNAVEYRRIPMRWVWLPLAKVQEGLGGKARAISALVVVALSLLISALVLLPYPLKMDANGQLLPAVRRSVYPAVDGEIKEFTVLPREVITENRGVARMRDLTFGNKLNELITERDAAGHEAEEFERKEKEPGLPVLERTKYRVDAFVKRELQRSKDRAIRDLIDRTAGDSSGNFWLLAPRFSSEEARQVTRREWTVLNANFREEWTGRTAKPTDPVLRLGASHGPWEIELKIPHKHIGQVLHAFEALEQRGQPPVLDVDFLLRSDPNRTFKGKLWRNRIAGEANPTRDDKDEAESVVLAYVSIDDDAIDPKDRLTRDLLLSGADVRAKVRCGPQRLGYALFYGVWEFFYEKVVFFF